MIVDGLEFSSDQMSADQQRAGLLAALAVLAEAGITAFEGAFARDLVQTYDELTWGAAPVEGDDEPLPPEEGGLSVPTGAQQAAYAAWEKAHEAALAAAGDPDIAGRDINLVFRALLPEQNTFGSA